MSFYTNKLANDLEYIKSVNVIDNNKIKKIVKDNKEYFLKETNFLTFLKTFYFKETLIFIFSLIFSFLFGKEVILINLIIFFFFAYIIIENKKILFEKISSYISYTISAIMFLSIILLITSFFYEILFNYAIKFFFTGYILFFFHFFTTLYFQYEKLYIIKDENNNTIKGYLIWEK